MKVLFIYTNIDSGEAPHFVHGVGALSAYLKQHGHDTDLLFLNELPTRESFQHKIDQLSPDVIGVSTGSNQWQYGKRLAGMVRGYYSGLVVFGGPHPTLAPEEVIGSPDVDVLCVGEGEGALLDLVQAVERREPIGEIANLWVKQDGKVFRNPPRPLIEDIDSLPFPDREIFDYPYLLKRYPLTATLLMSGRGCPYRCPYCINHALARIYRGRGKYTRLRSPKVVCDEVEILHNRWGMDDLLIYDDTFTYDRDWTVEFAEEYGRRFDIPYTINVRPETVDEELLVMLKESGLHRVMVGVEAGNERIRREVLKRPIPDDMLVWLFRQCRELGIRTWANTMMGIPGETPQNLEETIHFIRRLAPDHAQVMVFYPYPGTDLGDLCRDKGYVTGHNVVSTFSGDSVLKLPTVSRQQIKKAVQKFNWEALRGRLDWEAKGEIDLAAMYLDLAEEGRYKPLQAIEVGGEERICIPAHPPSDIRFRVDVKSGDVLQVSVALDPQVWELRPEGTRFLIERRFGRRVDVIYERIIDPKNVEGDRRWYDAGVPLDVGGRMELRFRTETVGLNTDYGWALWGHPYIEGVR